MAFPCADRPALSFSSNSSSSSFGSFTGGFVVGGDSGDGRQHAEGRRLVSTWFDAGRTSARRTDGAYRRRCRNPMRPRRKRTMAFARTDDRVRRSVGWRRVGGQWEGGTSRPRPTLSGVPYTWNKMYVRQYVCARAAGVCPSNGGILSKLHAVFKIGAYTYNRPDFRFLYFLRAPALRPRACADEPCTHVMRPSYAAWPFVACNPPDSVRTCTCVTFFTAAKIPRTLRKPTSPPPKWTTIVEPPPELVTC